MSANDFGESTSTLLSYKSNSINKLSVTQSFNLEFIGDIKDKFEQDVRWDGLKAYLTNAKMSKIDILDNYSHLWRIEKAFRIFEIDLIIISIYHRNLINNELIQQKILLTEEYRKLQNFIQFLILGIPVRKSGKYDNQRSCLKKAASLIIKKSPK